MEKILQFLSSLKQNNNREWFQANKDYYQSVKANHESIVRDIISSMSSVDKEIGLLQPSDCIFRIYRDVRFSTNKDPYKTAMGTYFAKGGKKSKFAGYYLHIEPQNSFIGGGLWQPPSEVLKLVRKEIYYNSEEFKSVIENPIFKKTFGLLWDEKLKRPPKEFPGDFHDIELLKFKSYVVGHPADDQYFTGIDIVKNVFSIFKVLKPFVDFLNQTMENTKV